NSNQLEHAGGEAAAHMPAESPLRSGPQIVGQPERGNRGDRGPVCEPSLPPDERQAQTTEVDGERAASVQDVAQLAGAMQEAPCVPSGRAMAQRKLDFVHVEPR